MKGRSIDLIDRRRDESVSRILSRGLASPPTMRGQIASMARCMSLRHVFWDASFGFILAALTAALIIMITAISPDSDRRAALIVAIPSLYLALSAFVETAERFGSLYELKRSCRFTICQITALRTQCFAAAGVAPCAIGVWITSADSQGFMSLMCLCLAALFVCAAASLAVMRWSRRRWAYAVFAAAWTVVSLAMPRCLGGAWSAFLAGVPALASLAVAVAGAALAAAQTRSILLEVKPYAYA
jgi:hypothetical protein